MDLGGVVDTIYEQLSVTRAVPLDPDGPDPSRLRNVVMLRLVRAHCPEFADATRRTAVSRERSAELADLFADELWQIGLDLAATAAGICRAALADLEASGVVPRSQHRRALREALAAWVMECYRRDGPPIGVEEQRRLQDRVVERARWYEIRCLTEQEFVAAFGAGYDERPWRTATRPQDLLLGERARPPLSDRAARTVQDGTDRDCYSRYQNYYNLAARSTGDTSAFEAWLGRTEPRAVAEHELERAVQPLGLHSVHHQQALETTFFALAMPVEGAHASGSGGAAAGTRAATTTAVRAERDRQPLGDRVELLGRLSAVHVRFMRRLGQSSWRITGELEAAQRRVLRKLWNDLHRVERETEAVATVGWVVARFHMCLETLIKDPPGASVAAPSDPGSWSGSAPEVDGDADAGSPPGTPAEAPGSEVTAALGWLAEHDPATLLQWAVRVQRDRHDVQAEVRAELRARPAGVASAPRVTAVVIRLLAGLGQEAPA